MSVQAQGADGEVAQAGHHSGSGAGADLGSVFVVGDVADPVQPVLDLPVAADVSGQLSGAGLVGGEAGDALGDLLAGALPVQAADVAADPEHLCRMWEADCGLGGDGSDAGGALLGAPVPAVEVDVLGREVADRAGQQPLAGGQQCRLVGFHGEHVVGVPLGHQVPRGLALGVQGVGGDHQPGQVQAGQQRREFGNLIGLGRAAGLPTLTDKGYTGAGIGIHAPTKASNLAPDNQTRNAMISALRAPAERANALLKRTWKAHERVTLDPWRIGAITAAALVLLHLQRPAR